MQQSSLGLPDNVGKFIAYLFGWISGLLMLVLEKNNSEIRYHGAQSVVLFGSLTVLNLLLPLIPAIGPLLLGILMPVTMLLWIALLVLSLLGAAPHLPVVENFTEQLLQRFGDDVKRLDRD